MGPPPLRALRDHDGARVGDGVLRLDERAARVGGDGDRDRVGAGEGAGRDCQCGTGRADGQGE